MWRRPILQVLDEGGADVMPKLAGYWLKVRWWDKAGKESDGAEIETIGPPSKFGLPRRGQKYSILAGWKDEGPVLQGVYTVQNLSARGSPESGDTITITLRAGDFVDKLKAQGSGHYDEGKTFGEIMRAEAKRAGLEAVVDPDLEKIKLPYQLRWQQSGIDFLHELAERVQGTVKPSGGKLIAAKRGGGKSAGGSDLETIQIKRRRSYSYEATLEPRELHGHIAAAWSDEKSGKRKLEKVATGLDGPIDILPHPFRSQDEAKQAAKARAYERGNESFSGVFEQPGLPRARAEAPAIIEGFGWPIDGPAKAEEVSSEISVSGAYKTTVNVKSGDSDKGKKAK